ncbi:hypothetical protein NTD78_RS22655 [Enterobacter bugandensis]
MPSSVSDPVEMLEACLKALKSRGLPDGAGLKPDMFPDKKLLQADTELQLAIIAVEAEKLLKLQPGDTLFGIECDYDDRNSLIKMFIDDLVQFTTLHNISLGVDIMSFGQMRIAEHAFWHLSLSPLLPATYENIQQTGGNGRIFDIYSIPFRIRVALELKLKSITGFEKYEISSPGRHTITSTEFPFSRLVRKLKSIDCLALPCTPDNILNIYKWASGFCHTGEKEFIWLSMQALKLVAPLFLYEEQRRREISLTGRWSEEGLSKGEILNKVISWPGPLNPVSFYREGWSPLKLQQRLNSDEEKRIKTEQKKNRRTTGYRYFFSDTKLSEAHCCFCGRTGKYY